ncbi:MAG: hypothetical protein KAJ14_01880 [Candidatus Omnitrophica bacterium]|nr:hypothetical protein [Candidatus Omnitrophota bacterium]
MHIVLFVFLGFIVVFSAFSQNTRIDRRIEEEKRWTLQSAEVAAGSLEPANEAVNKNHSSLYIKELFLKKIAYRYDLYKVIAIILGVESKYTDTDSQIEFLKTNKIIDESLPINFKLDKPLQKGLTAYLFCRALDLRGGILARIIGLNERRAIKELGFQGIISEGNVSDYISGKELIIILTRAASFIVQTENKKNINNYDGIQGVID